MLMNLLLGCQWKYLAQAGTQSPPRLRVRSLNEDSQCTKQCCRLAKQPACSKLKWLSQMLITRMFPNEGIPLYFIASASHNPQVHFILRDPLLAMCSFPLVQSLHVSVWAPFLRPPLAPLVPPYVIMLCYLGSDFLF